MVRQGESPRDLGISTMLTLSLLGAHLLIEADHVCDRDVEKTLIQSTPAALDLTVGLEIAYAGLQCLYYPQTLLPSRKGYHVKS